jgi:drug/metabolite transporter (DMT)-like permease
MMGLQSASGPARPDPTDWTRAAPALFVLIWSTGFIVARYGMPHAPPFSFLAWRFFFSVVCFAVWIQLAGARWPREPRQWFHLGVAGLLMQAGYLGGVWAAVKSGMSAGMAALIVGLQPLLTALWMARRGSNAHAGAVPAFRQWAGLLLGLGGLVLVVWRKLGVGEAQPESLAMAVTALLAITAGTLYQKRWVKGGDVRCAAAIQMAAAGLAVWPLAWLEAEPVRWVPQLAGAMAWSVLALSLGANSLLMLLIQRGAATRVASLMYLVPPSTALLAWLLFGEALTPVIVLGMLACAAGVAMVLSPPRARC